MTWRSSSSRLSVPSGGQGQSNLKFKGLLKLKGVHQMTNSCTVPLSFVQKRSFAYISSGHVLTVPALRVSFGLSCVWHFLTFCLVRRWWCICDICCFCVTNAINNVLFPVYCEIVSSSLSNGNHNQSKISTIVRQTNQNTI